MKLSMWILANRLGSFEPRISIHSPSRRCLLSARRTSVPDCVWVHEEKDGVCISCDEDWIILPGLDLATGFELVQGIFDFFDDWEEELLDGMSKCDYQRIVELCWQVFENPVFLLNGNRELLGISDHYPYEEMDSEWVYLCKNRRSSPESVKRFLQSSSYSQSIHEGINHFSPHSLLKFGGMMYSMFHQGFECGRLQLMEKDRLLNEGDVQLLEMVAHKLKHCLLSSAGLGHEPGNIYMLANLISHTPVSRSALSQLLSYRNWDIHDTYRIWILHPRQESRISAAAALSRLFFLINYPFPHTVAVEEEDRILVVCNGKSAIDQSFPDYLSSYQVLDYIYAACSLPVRGINHLGFLYTQAEYALENGIAWNPDRNILSFEDYAVDFLIESPSPEERLYAVHPGLISVLEAVQKEQYPVYDTLAAYMANDCAISETAHELGIHRNTLIYRISRITDYCSRDLAEYHTREYMKYSLRVLELYRERQRLPDMTAVLERIMSDPYLLEGKNEDKHVDAGQSSGDAVSGASFE